MRKLDKYAEGDIDRGVLRLPSSNRDTVFPILDEVTFGRVLIEMGKSHSCEMPTKFFAKPSLQTISVAEGNKVTIRMFYASSKRSN